MKTKINGKTYNTDTAKEVCYWNNCGDTENGSTISWNDFRVLEEIVYQKKDGSYFLVAHGGAMTYASHKCGDGSYCAGVFVFVLSEKEAKDIIENAPKKRDGDTIDMLNQMFKNDDDNEYYKDVTLKVKNGMNFANPFAWERP